MASHIVAVCVVCLLCAERIPCQQHFEKWPETSSTSSPLTAAESFNNDQMNDHKNETLNTKSSQHSVIQSISPSNQNNSSINGNKGITSGTSRRSSRSISTRRIDKIHSRQQRHAGHHAGNLNEKRPQITENFLRRIFEEYGETDGTTIHISEFRRMLKQLGLNHLLEQRISSTTLNNDSCIPDVKLLDYVRSHDDHNDDGDGDGNDNNVRHRNEHLLNHINCQRNDTEKPCDHKQHEYQITSHEENNVTLNGKDLINICPVLLYQLSSYSETERSGCIRNSVLDNVQDFQASLFSSEKEDIMYVWIYAIISVFACGILGLVGVAIIPFMDSRFYKHIIQFLVSLAVGTMTGDALLHLLPHSLAGQTESNMIFKGLTCMSGIIFFYITEHGLTMISEWRKTIAKQETKKPSRAKVVRDPDSSINNSIAGDKLCKSKYSSYPYCYDEIAMDTKNDVWMHMPHNRMDSVDNGGSNCNSSNSEKRKKGKDATGNCYDANETAQSLLSTSQNNYAPISELNHHQHHNHNNHQKIFKNNTLSTSLDDHLTDGGTLTTTNGNENGNKDTSNANNDTVTVILREHESSHHGHSHKHGHVHSPPESLSAVAWMIIMGDGLHNFTDGMAIGAAFAENIAGGFSTSLAVFCHELPHELGDFAILMKAGMSVKSAVYYNLMTGVLSFIGMVFGIVFGQSAEAAQWMFAAAAGLFIYIALVDMMPELSAAHKSLQQFALQILGMSCGVLIMLLIAVFEGDLMKAFSSSPTTTLAGSHNHLH